MHATLHATFGASVKSGKVLKEKKQECAKRKP